MLLQHVITVSPTTIGIRSTESRRAVTLAANQHLVESEADLKGIPSTTLIRLHNHLHDEGHVKRLDADTLGRCWAALQDHRTANPPLPGSPIKAVYPPDPAMPREAPEELPEKAPEPSTRRDPAPRSAGKPPQAGLAPRATPARVREPSPDHPVGGKIALIAGLLLRPEGCTTADILAATGWPSVSVPASAKSAGLVLRKEKVDGVTQYWGSRSSQ